jgi:hypothetical protein
MKVRKALVLAMGLLLPAFWQPAPAAAAPQVSSLQEEERDNKIRARATDYEARLKVLYEKRVQDWAVSFLARRQAAIQRAGEALAAKAAAIRAVRHGSWDEVGADPELLALEKQQMAALLEPQQIRRELTVWARDVEDQTRSEMIEFFRQVIAEDLGRVFDRRLRGQVVQAVQAIPLETLVTANAGRIEARIRSALPTSVLTRQQRLSIATAASALAFAAGPAIALAAGVPHLVKEIASISALLAQVLTSQGLEMLDRAWSGEPNASALSRQVTLALKDWQRSELEGRLQRILTQFREQVMDTLEEEARRVNVQGGGR